MFMEMVNIFNHSVLSASSQSNEVKNLGNEKQSLVNKNSSQQFFLSIRPLLELLPFVGPLERYMMPTLVAALLGSCRAGSDLVKRQKGLRSF